MSYKHFKLHMRCLFIKHLYHVISLDYFRQVLFSALTPMMSYLLHYGAERVFEECLVPICPSLML